ncbi:hypothetical protein SCHPADRAFT_944301 [Schizopora paradoxa]|uniref:Uncharacterized protein n=1 Tax=Schizopora paradoxa TaxID=27342 RepID=A0A0H2RUZ2_9AGAM|nr:hypothetical protein SCHPADRAFT_944301 [Schizopora paradoxa]
MSFSGQHTSKINSERVQPDPEILLGNRKIALGDYKESVPCEKSTLDGLRRSYKDVCEAVAEFEISASTLRADSRALRLCRELVTRSVPALFDVFRDLLPESRPNLPKHPEVKIRMDKWVVTMKSAWKHREHPARTDTRSRVNRGPKTLVLEMEREKITENAKGQGTTATSGECGTQVLESEMATLATLALALTVLSSSYGSHVSEESVRSVYDAKLILMESERALKNSIMLDRGTIWRVFFALEEVRRALRAGIELKTSVAKALEEAKHALTKNESIKVKDKTTSRSSVWSKAWNIASDPQRYAKDSTRSRTSRESSLAALGEIWDLKRFKRMQHEHWWMMKDRKEYPGQWEDHEWTSMQLWWNDLREWREGHELRVRTVDNFKATCSSLLSELGKIDGKTSARESYVLDLNGSQNEPDRCDKIIDFVHEMKVALSHQEETRFAYHLNAALALIQASLRSEEIKNGELWVQS